MRKHILQNKKGFSLIETLIAISILMIAVTGPLALVQAGLFSSLHQRNQVVASYLAQEALEYVKNIRDTNSYTQYTTPVNWLMGPDGSLLTDTCGINGCYIDPHGKLSGSNGFIKSASVNLLFLRQTVSGGGVFSYSYDTGPNSSDTLYTRVVKVVSIAPDEARVSVTINWKDNAIARTYTVSENIYNYEQP